MLQINVHRPLFTRIQLSQCQSYTSVAPKQVESISKHKSIIYQHFSRCIYNKTVKHIKKWSKQYLEKKKKKKVVSSKERQNIPWQDDEPQAKIPIPKSQALGNRIRTRILRKYLTITYRLYIISMLGTSISITESS